ncbi:MAG: hypothetical protein R3B57_13315 [Phycisphaerales bacterium]
MGLRVLFFDLNSYFASVEQQLRPELRGKPVGVVPVMSDTTCCIAASVEAKAAGVKTGTGVREAKAICPGIRLVLSRPEEYVKMHHRVREAVETCIPIAAMRSIDEGVCRLGIGERDRASAEDLARRIKGVIRERIGDVVRCSIGLAPNELLAKIGTDMRKPDGLMTIEEHELPGVLYELELTDLPGIAGRMRRRLDRAGVRSVQDLCALSEDELGRAWGSVVGRRWWYWLRGQEVVTPRIRRHTIGHQHVLAPQMRTDEGARAVAFRLLHKAAARARHEGYAARALWVGVRPEEIHGGDPGVSIAYAAGPSSPGREGSVGGGRWWSRENAWEEVVSLGPGCVDTGAMACALAEAWSRRPPTRPKWIGVTLLGLVEREMTLALFERERHDEALSAAMDRINTKYGRNAVYYASMHDARAQRVGGIAFHVVPDLALPDAVA